MLSPQHDVESPIRGIDESQLDCHPYVQWLYSVTKIYATVLSTYCIRKSSNSITMTLLET